MQPAVGVVLRQAARYWFISVPRPSESRNHIITTNFHFDENILNYTEAP